MIGLRDLTLVLCLGLAGCAGRLAHVASAPISDETLQLPDSSPSTESDVRAATDGVKQPETNQVSAKAERLLDELQEQRGLSSAKIAEIRDDIAEAPPASHPLLVRMLAATVAARNTTHELTPEQATDKLAAALPAREPPRQDRNRINPAPRRTGDPLGPQCESDLPPAAVERDVVKYQPDSVGVREFFRVAHSIDSPARPQPSVVANSAYAQANLDRAEYGVSGAPSYATAAPRAVDQAVLLEEHRDRMYEGSLAAASVLVDTSDGLQPARPPAVVEPDSPERTMPQMPDPGWREHLDAAIEGLQKELAAASDDSELAARREAQLRMLYLIADQRDEAIRPIDQLAPQEQEFWGHQLHGLSLMLDHEQIPTPHQRAAAAIEQLATACDKLSESCTLRLKGLAFCREVMSYGQYREFDKDVFKPGQEIQLYVELQNFTVEATSQGHETAFEGSYHIFDEMGRPVFDHAFPAASETCRNRRRDLFVCYRTWIPKQLYPGRYTLQLQVEDVKGKKFGQATRDFTVAR